MYLTTEDENRLLQALAEQPVEEGRLWTACWGEENQVPAIVARIKRNIVDAAQSRVILVHGRYGTGKSSFMKSVHEETKDQVIPLWLDMPSLTSRIESSALAAVMMEIVRELQKTHDELGVDRSEDCDFGQALEDLWRIEAGTMSSACVDPCKPVIPPEPNRMAGTVRGEGRRTVRANTLEREISRCIDSLPPDKRKMLVFLDDLDRCERVVARDVVRLLLRFGTNHVTNVHFMLACDWDVLEQGVKDWMHKYGKADDGAPLVTANSALEKYIHIAVELPSMGKAARQLNDYPKPQAFAELLKGRTTDASEYKEVQLFDVLINDQIYEALVRGQA
jgi:hypothetical protein